MKLTLHLNVHVPEVTSQSRAPSDDLCDCRGHAAAVSSHRSSVSKRNECTCGFQHPMGHASWVPSTWCGLSPGLVGLQLLNESQIQRLSSGSGTEARHARSLMKIDENCSSCSISGHPSRRPTDLIAWRCVKYALKFYYR